MTYTAALGCIVVVPLAFDVGATSRLLITTLAILPNCPKKSVDRIICHKLLDGYPLELLSISNTCLLRCQLGMQTDDIHQVFLDHTHVCQVPSIGSFHVLLLPFFLFLFTLNPCDPMDNQSLSWLFYRCFQQHVLIGTNGLEFHHLVRIFSSAIQDAIRKPNAALSFVMNVKHTRLDSDH